MIERKFVEQNMKEQQIQEYISNTLKNVGHSHTKLIKTPLGEKIIIYASRPGLIVGRKGGNIKKLTIALKREFKLENPQIEIAEVEKQEIDAQIVAERIASSLEKFGSSKFKGIGHKSMSDAMKGGALGIEILISGKIPSSRARTWRFYQGYLKKCGDVGLVGVKHAYATANLKTGAVGVIVKIMPADTVLPDRVKILDDLIIEEEVIEEKKEEPKKTVKKKTNKKVTKKKEENKDETVKKVEEAKEE